jgi:hypothetical protein
MEAVNQVPMAIACLHTCAAASIRVRLVVPTHQACMWCTWLALHAAMQVNGFSAAVGPACSRRHMCQQHVRQRACRNFTACCTSMPTRTPSVYMASTRALPQPWAGCMLTSVTCMHACKSILPPPIDGITRTMSSQALRTSVRDGGLGLGVAVPGVGVEVASGGLHTASCCHTSPAVSNKDDAGGAGAVKGVLVGQWVNW